MKTVPSEFSNSAWNCFIFAKEIAYKNYQQTVDSDNLLIALIKDDKITKNILKKNNIIKIKFIAFNFILRSIIQILVQK